MNICQKQVRVLFILILPFITQLSVAQNAPEMVANIPVNYDEALVGQYVLPDPLVFPNGKKVKSVKQWEQKRRPQILSLFEKYQFGKIPMEKRKLNYRLIEQDNKALNGMAVRKEVDIYFTDDTSKQKMRLLIYTPADAKSSVPVFLNIGFSPNAFTVSDEDVTTGYVWNRDHKRVLVNRPADFTRGMDVQEFLSQGLGFATVYYGDIEPDFPEGIRYGIRSIYLQDGVDSVASDEWGAISAWSWGLSYVMDYLETDKQVDAKKVALFGVSRLGKTVLWTGARDSRFALIIASCSGEGGAAISRRWFGETIDHMTHPTRYFYQFAANWRNFKDDPSKSPVDANMLVSLIAPRPLLLQTGDTDLWSDPKGEFLAAVAAEPVYELFDCKGLDTEEMPPAGDPILNDIGYYMHAGGHGARPQDYNIFIKFINKHFFLKN